MQQMLKFVDNVNRLPVERSNQHPLSPGWTHSQQRRSVATTIECSDQRHQEKKIRFTVTEPGWILVRAIADVDHTFRFANVSDADELRAVLEPHEEARAFWSERVRSANADPAP